jgi:hypothetical protein
LIVSHTRCYIYYALWTHIDCGDILMTDLQA